VTNFASYRVLKVSEFIMSHINDNGADAVAAEASKPPVDLAKEEFRTILENIDELKLSERIWQLHRTRSRLRQKRKVGRPWQLLGRPLTSLEKLFLLIIASCTVPLICAAVVNWNTNDKVIKKFYVTRYTL